MISFRGRQAEQIKHAITAVEDRFVEKYQIHPTTYPRRSVYTATTNEWKYWRDSTGARRLIPIRVGAIRRDLIAENRLQWFAEAKARFLADEPWWEFPAELAAEQDERQEIDEWENILRSAIAAGRTVHDGYAEQVVPWPSGWISSVEVARDWLKLAPHQQGKACGPRIGAVMRRMGYLPLKKGGERGWNPADES